MSIILYLQGFGNLVNSKICEQIKDNQVEELHKMRGVTPHFFDKNGTKVKVAQCLNEHSELFSKFNL